MTRRTLWPLLAALFALALLAPSAGAAGKGTTVVALNGKAAAKLRDLGVTFAATRPAKLRAGKLRLPVSGGRVGTGARLRHRGALRLRLRSGGRTRSLKVSGFEVRLGKRSRVLARVGKKRLTLFAVRGGKGRKLSSDAGSARLRGARLVLTAKGARALAGKLRLGQAPRGAIGRLTVKAALRSSGSKGGGGGSGGGTPKTTPITSEPPVLARPASAVNLGGATITWHVRDSFIQYVNSGEGTSTFGGATSDPPSQQPGSDAVLVYQFRYPFKSGWVDPATGKAGVYFNGGVNFSYKDHDIDLDAKEPEVEVNGTASRAIFRFAGRGGTNPGNKRAVLVNLDLSKAKSKTVSPDGKAVAYEEIPGTIPEGTGGSVFAGFYGPGDPFGWISVTYTRP